MEEVDLVDAGGTVVRRNVTRAQAEQHSRLYVQIVIVVIFNSIGQVVVHKRAESKAVAPGVIDHVCGVVAAGEDPIKSAMRESWEELGVSPDSLEIIASGINLYQRYRHLLVGESQEPPRPWLVDPGEVSWIGRLYPEELSAGQASGALRFVDGFFQDLESAVRYWSSTR